MRQRAYITNALRRLVASPGPSTGSNLGVVAPCLRLLRSKWLTFDLHLSVVTIAFLIRAAVLDTSTFFPSSSSSVSSRQVDVQASRLLRLLDGESSKAAWAVLPLLSQGASKPERPAAPGECLLQSPHRSADSSMSLPPQRRTVAPAQLAAGAQAHPHAHLLHAQVRDPRGDGDSAGAAGTRVETHLEDLQEGSPFLVAVAGGTGQTPVEFGPVPASPVFQELYRNPIFLQVRAAACAGLRRLARESRGSDFLAEAETCAEVRKERFASRWPSHVAEASSLRSANGISTEEAKGSSSTSSPETHPREGRQLPWRPTVSWYAFRHEPAVCRLAEELFSAFGKAAFVDLDLFNAIVDVLTPDWLVSEVHPHERTVHPQPPSSLSVEPSSSSSLTAELPPHAQSSSPSSSCSSSSSSFDSSSSSVSCLCSLCASSVSPRCSSLSASSSVAPCVASPPICLSRYQSEFLHLSRACSSLSRLLVALETEASSFVFCQSRSPVPLSPFRPLARERSPSAGAVCPASSPCFSSASSSPKERRGADDEKTFCSNIERDIPALVGWRDVQKKVHNSEVSLPSPSLVSSSPGLPASLATPASLCLPAFPSTVSFPSSSPASASPSSPPLSDLTHISSSASPPTSSLRSPLPPLVSLSSPSAVASAPLATDASESWAVPSGLFAAAGTAEETAKETGRQASSTALAGGVLTALETLARAISVILRDEERRPPGLPVPPRFYESLPFALTNVLEVAVDFRVCLNGTRSRRKRNSPTVRTLADGVHRLREKPRLREALEGDKETTYSRSGGESGDRGEEAAEQRSRQAVETAGSEGEGPEGLRATNGEGEEVERRRDQSPSRGEKQRQLTPCGDLTQGGDREETEEGKLKRMENIATQITNDVSVFVTALLNEETAAVLRQRSEARMQSPSCCQRSDHREHTRSWVSPVFSSSTTCLSPSSPRLPSLSPPSSPSSPRLPSLSPPSSPLSPLSAARPRVPWTRERLRFLLFRLASTECSVPASLCVAFCRWMLFVCPGASRLLAAPFRGLLSRQVEDEDARGRREPSGRGVAAGGDRREGSSPQASPISHRRGVDSSDPAEALGLSGDETRERGDSERRGEATSRCVAGAAWEHGAAKEATETRRPEDAKDQLLLDVLEEEHRLLSGGLREILMSEDWARALYSLAILFPQTSLPFRQLYLAACILPCSSVEGDGGQTALMPTLKPDEKQDASSQRPTEMLTSSPQPFAPKSTSPFLPSPSSSSASSASSASPSFSSSLSAPAASTVLSDVVAFSAFCQICRLLVLSTSSPFSPQVSSLSRVPWKRSDACAALGWPDDVVSPSFCLENPVPFFRSQLLRPLVRETLEEFLVSPRCSVSIPSSSRPSPAPLSSPSLSPLPHASPFSPPRSSPSSSRSAPSSSPLSESWGAGVSPLGHEETDEATRREPLRLLFRAVGASLARRLERETDRQLQCLPAHRGRRFDWGGNPKEEREGEQRQKKSRYVFCVADDADTTRLLDSTLRGGMLSPCSLSSLSFASPRSSACPPSSPGDADGEARRSGGSWIGQSGDDDPDCLLFPSAVASLSATQNISEPLYEKILTLAFSTGEDYWRRREKGELNRSEAQRTTARHLRMPRPLPPARIHPPSPQAAYASSIYCRKERTLGTVRSFTSASSPRPCDSSPARGTPSVASAFPSPHPSPSALGRLETPFAEAAGEGQRHTASPEKRELSGSTFEKERSLFSFFLPAETLQTEAEEAPLPRLERDAEPHALEPSTQTLQEPPGPLREKEREAKRGRDKPAETEQASEKDAPVPKARECEKPEENAKDTNAEQREETGKIGGLLRYQNDRRRSPWSGDKDEKRQGLAAPRRWLDIVKEGEKNRYSKDLPHVVWQSKHLMVLYKPPFWRVNLERSEKPETVRERIALSAPSVAASLPESPLQFSPSLRKRTLEILARGGLSEPLHAYMQIALGRTQDAHGEWTGEGGESERGEFAGLLGGCSPLAVTQREREHRKREEERLALLFDASHQFGIGHRLDTPTSGPLLVAKSYAGLAFLRAQLASWRPKKVYLALVFGAVPLREKVRLVHPLRPTFEAGKTGKKEMEVANTVDAKIALSFLSGITHYSYGGRDFTLCRVEPVTGRTHQIRAQLAHIGHPIVADPIYVNDPADRALGRSLSDRVFLHCVSLSFLNILENENRTGTSDFSPEDQFDEERTGNRKERPPLQADPSERPPTAIPASRFSFRQVTVETPLHADLRRTLRSLKKTSR
ncbi:RNA pseudouridine synthase superfamily protein [Toxoplasma gondii VEG]|nr:RNA pseudouridine synthase superfamily protein [Toxoplasma gondii VEG]KFG45848.1 RNA pseudouridine synthase superfamily protein [Toxoplasma gondii p89]